ncbi:MAG: protoporphyrinogen oxidase, partial [Opitutales bacterium]
VTAVSTPLWSLSGKLRVLKEPFVKPIDPDQEESAAGFVRRRLGQELYEYAINPLIGGIYAGDPEQLSLRYAFPKLYTLEQEHGGLIRGAIAKMRQAEKSNTPAVRKRIISFKDGLHELPRHLARALGDNFKTSVSIESIQKDGSSWTVCVDGQSMSYDELILTVPAHVLPQMPFATEILQDFDPLQSIAYPPVSVLSLAFNRSEVAHPLDGFGALVPECEQRKILGVLFPSSIFPGRAAQGEVLLTAFVGGERQPELATDKTDKVRNLVIDELRELLGVRKEPTFIHHRYWPKAIPQYKLGYGELLQQMKQIEAKFPGLKLAGNYRTGISLSYCIESALNSVVTSA